MVNARLQSPSLQRGVTLVELVISMAVISIAVVGILGVIALTSSHRGDPMVQRQAIAIAEAYMEEILLQGFVDDDVDVGGFEDGETRSTFDDVNDYHDLEDLNGARDRTGGLIDGLENYNVEVDVVPAVLGPSGALEIDNTGPLNAQRITVKVTYDHLPNLSIQLQSFRTRQ